MKDMKPKRDPIDIVSHGDASIRETETIEGPSAAFPKVDVETISPISIVQKGGYKWKRDDRQDLPEEVELDKTREKEGCENEGKGSV